MRRVLKHEGQMPRPLQENGGRGRPSPSARTSESSETANILRSLSARTACRRTVVVGNFVRLWGRWAEPPAAYTSRADLGCIE
jgi:hypothetical protein